MNFNYYHLDERTRAFMIEEIKNAQKTNNLYFSKRFNSKGNMRWPELIVESAVSHDEHWLAYMVEAEGLMKDYETASKPTGGYTTKHVPSTAAETLADGQFNRFYIIGVCRRAIMDGKTQVTVYRAKERAEQRSESNALVKKTMDAEKLIKELRSVQTSLGHELLKPNSGLSVKM